MKKSNKYIIIGLIIITTSVGVFMIFRGKGKAKLEKK